MLGEKIGQTNGRVTNRRVLGCEGGGVRVEVSFQTTGKLLGHDISELGTYTSMMKPGGSFFGEGQGVLMTKDGDAILWRGSGAGKPTGKGMGATYRGAIYYDTASPKFTQLNAICGIFEYEVDENGNTSAIISEWK
jgi:hypothetical protein